MNHVKCYMKGYPRPQLVRGDWTDLNGAWRFGFGEETKECDALGGKLPREIRVPFSYETQMSGIGDATPRKTVWYAREIEGKYNPRLVPLGQKRDAALKTIEELKGKAAASAQ